MGNWWSYETDCQEVTEITEDDKNIENLEKIQNKITEYRTNCDITQEYIEELKKNIHFRRRRKSK